MNRNRKDTHLARFAQNPFAYRHKYSTNWYYEAVGSSHRSREMRQLFSQPANSFLKPPHERRKTSSLASFQGYLSTILPVMKRVIVFHSRNIQSHVMNSRVRKKKKKLFELMTSELSHYNPNNVVVMGNGVMNNEIIRKKMGPIKGITRHLDQKLLPKRLVMIDEHKSSAVCARCHGSLISCDSQGVESKYCEFRRKFAADKKKQKKMERQAQTDPSSNLPAPSNPPDPPDPPVSAARRPERKSNAAASRVEFRGTTFRLKGSSRQSYSRILYCPQCKTCMHRDGNAARNMLYCYLFASVFNGSRPPVFSKAMGNNAPVEVDSQTETSSDSLSEYEVEEEVASNIRSQHDLAQ